MGHLSTPCLYADIYRYPYFDSIRLGQRVEYIDQHVRGNIIGSWTRCSFSTSYADTHDLDKLAGWYRDMVSAVSGQFPVYVLFLVSGEDHRAHNIFRQYRSTFQARNVPYQNLIIFGQHGVSTTVLGLLSELDLLLQSLPLIALFDAPPTTRLRILSLDQVGSSAKEGQEPWKTILDSLVTRPV